VLHRLSRGNGSHQLVPLVPDVPDVPPGPAPSTLAQIAHASTLQPTRRGPAATISQPSRAAVGLLVRSAYDPSLPRLISAPPPIALVPAGHVTVTDFTSSLAEELAAWTQATPRT
jgi:hypothetical protein